MSNLGADKQTSRRANKGAKHKVLSIVCATLLCYLCATNILAKGVKCLYINVLDKQCVFPIGLHCTSGGASDALIMADDGGCTDNQVGISDVLIDGVMGCCDGCQVGVRQVGIHAQGWGGFRYPNQGTVEKPTQTNPIFPQTLFPQIFPIPLMRVRACARVFQGVGALGTPIM